MNVLGSVFLGDAVRHRAYSPTIGSPPTSPVPAPVPGPKTTSSSRAPAIDPELSLELRIRWLECLLHGVRQESRRAKGGKNSGADERDESRKGEVLVLKAEEVQRKLDRTVQGNDGLRKFMDRYDQHAQILTPSFALSGSAVPPTYSTMTPEELDAFLSEMEPDIKSADRDLREIDVLEKRGILGAGKLSEFEEIKPRLDALSNAHEEDLARAADLERRISSVLRQYATRIDALSELFVEWNDVLSVAEDKISRLEREKADKIRLGYETQTDG